MLPITKSFAFAADSANGVVHCQKTLGGDIVRDGIAGAKGEAAVAHRFGDHIGDVVIHGRGVQTADSVGINVYKMRYAGVIISGALGGLGGLIYIAAANSTWHFDVGVAGAGFLALAVMIFGQWKPIRIALAALLFGLFRALSNVYLGIDWLANIGISGTVYNMLPYIVSLIVLAFTSKKSRAPKAEGIPYDKGMR